MARPLARIQWTNIARRTISTASAANSSANKGVSMLKRVPSSGRVLSALFAAVGLAGGLSCLALSGQAEADKPRAQWSPSEFRPLKLLAVRDHTSNSKIFEFDLGGPQTDSVGVSHYVLTKCPGKDGKDVIRPYTPLDASTYANGRLSLLIKHYPDGAMSSHVFGLQPGQSLLLKGPLPKLAYEPNKYKQVGMIAGGTGIAPMLQVLERSLYDQSDSTRFHLLFGNVSSGDILLKEHLDELQRKFPDRFQAHYLIDKPEDGWSGSVGYVSKDLIGRHLPPPTAGNFVYVCGPPAMYKAVSGMKAPDFSQGELGGLLAELGYKAENVFKF